MENDSTPPLPLRLSRLDDIERTILGIVEGGQRERMEFWNMALRELPYLLSIACAAEALDAALKHSHDPRGFMGPHDKLAKALRGN